MVLDVLMPRLDGLEVCRRLRARRRPAPVLMLTAMDAVAIAWRASTPAPTTTWSSRSRSRSCSRACGRCCAAPRDDGDGDDLRFGDLELDPARYEARRGDRPIELTRTEFALLELFLRNPGQVLPRDVIFERVWGYDFGPTPTRSTSTSATCGARPRRTASRA